MGLLNYDETVREEPAAGESLSMVVFLANLALVAACPAAYSRASLVGAQPHPIYGLTSTLFPGYAACF